VDDNNQGSLSAIKEAPEWWGASTFSADAKATQGLNEISSHPLGTRSGVSLGLRGVMQSCLFK
jgi:hypothetical protein